MKLNLILSFALALFLPLAARAELHQVASASTTTATVLIVPGSQVNVVTFQNVGANQINLSIDGGSSAGGQDPSTGASGNGLQLAAGQSVTLYGPWFRGTKIVGVMATGTTTINVITNAPFGNSLFPAN